MWETGKREPDIDTINRLAQFFHVSADYLLGNVNDPFFYPDSERIKREINSCGDEGEKGPAPEGEHDISGLSDIYFSLAKDLQDAKIDPEDIRNFARIIAKNMQKSEGEL